MKISLKLPFPKTKYWVRSCRIYATFIRESITHSDTFDKRILLVRFNETRRLNLNGLKTTPGHIVARSRRRRQFYSFLKKLYLYCFSTGIFIKTIWVPTVMNGRLNTRNLNIVLHNAQAFASVCTHIMNILHYLYAFVTITCVFYYEVKL